MEDRPHKGWNSTVVAVAVVFAGFGTLLFVAVRQQGIPTREELAVLNHGKAQADFRMPRAKGFYYSGN